MFEIEKEEAFENVSKEGRGNLLFADLRIKDIEEFKRLVTTPQMLEKGFILIDFKKSETRRIEELIQSTFESLIKSSKDAVLLSQKKEELKRWNEYLNSIPAWKKYNYKDTLNSIYSSIEELELAIQRAYRNDKFSKSIIASKITEEYVLGTIAREISKNEELKKKCYSRGFESKLSYFEEFINSKVLPREKYEAFNDNSFSFTVDGYGFVNYNDIKLTLCFINVQNASNLMLNIINNFTCVGSSRIRTIVLTTRDRLTTYSIRDQEKISNLENFSSYSLSKSRHQK